MSMGLHFMRLVAMLVFCTLFQGLEKEKRLFIKCVTNLKHLDCLCLKQVKTGL